MRNLAQVLQYAYPTLVLSRHSVVQLADRSDGRGPFIAQWDPAIGPEPTLSALAVIEASPGFQSFSTPEAIAARREATVPDRKRVRDHLAQAIAESETFLALATPTPAQVAAMVKKLAATQQLLMRRVAQID